MSSENSKSKQIWMFPLMLDYLFTSTPTGIHVIPSSIDDYQIIKMIIMNLS